jgi:hypothetical protein
MQVVEELVDIVQIAGTTKAEILQALRNGFNDFEDSIQYATALAVGDIEAIVTRNVKDYEKSDIAVFTPENYLKFIGDKM